MSAAHDILIRPLARAQLAQARALLAASCTWDRAAEVADEVLLQPGPQHGVQPLAGLVGSPGEERIVGVAAVSGPWLRILAVDPEQRGRGVGSALLAAAERAIGASGERAVRVMDQPGNYLAPGIDVRNREAIAWLTRRGYCTVGENCNLLVAARANPRVTDARAAELAGACTGYRIRRARASERDWLCAAITRAFSAEWAFEVARALAHTPVGVHLAVVDAAGQLAAFAAHDGNNRGLGWFGPAGTLPEHRGRGLGHALVCACLVDVARAGHDVCEIAWIGPRGFYERTVGTVGERRFARLRKDLS